MQCPVVFAYKGAHCKIPSHVVLFYSVENRVHIECKKNAKLRERTVTRKITLLFNIWSCVLLDSVGMFKMIFLEQ